MSAKRASVVVVDDDEDVRDSMLVLLEDLGYEAVGAENGLSALELLRELPKPPDVIFLDLMMPVMNGWQFLEEREKEPALAGIPVVIVSANVTAKVQGTNVIGFVKKPLSYAALKEILARACGTPG